MPSLPRPHPSAAGHGHPRGRAGPLRARPGRCARAPFALLPWSGHPDRAAETPPAPSYQGQRSLGSNPRSAGPAASAVAAAATARWRGARAHGQVIAIPYPGI